MKISITDELKTICEDIVNEGKSNKDWAEIESDDMFQTESFCGGYDADEEAFCFSYYNHNKNEYWFQLTLDEVSKVVSGEISSFNCRQAD
jgi:hypothetical protein